MRAMVLRSTSARLTNTPLTMEDHATPTARGPFDVVVEVAAAGVCRTDLHIATGETTAPLPLVLGHENAGVVHEVGESVTSVSAGDAVICYPFVSSGLSEPERSGDDNNAPERRTPGITVNGGYAEYLLTSERAMVKVGRDVDLASLAPLTDAGITAYRACRRLAEVLRPGESVAVIGIGGLGHLAVQILRALTPARIVAADVNPAARQLAIACGADDATTLHRLSADHPGSFRAVADFVGSDATSREGLELLAFGGTYAAVGVGGLLSVPMAAIVEGEKRIAGTFVGNYSDLLGVVELAASGAVTPHIVQYPLEAANQALNDLADGAIVGRAVLVPTRRSSDSAAVDRSSKGPVG